MLLQEFHRLLVPGGMLIATTRARDFILFCKALRDDPRLDEKPDWLKESARIFLDVDAAISAYDNGQYCYDCYGSEGRWSFWGEACISKSYVEKRCRKFSTYAIISTSRGARPQNVEGAKRKRA